MSSIFGLWSSYMLEYCWLFTLLLRSARCFTGVEGKWTLLPPISPPFSPIQVSCQEVLNSCFIFLLDVGLMRLVFVSELILVTCLFLSMCSFHLGYLICFSIVVHNILSYNPFYFIFKRFYLFIFRESGMEGEWEGEKNQCVVVSLICPLLGTWPATQACALTGNRTSGPLVHRSALSPLGHTSQGCIL